MARTGLRNRIRALEKRQSKKLPALYVLPYAVAADMKPTSPEIAAWLSAPNPKLESAPAALLGGRLEHLAPRIILAPEFESMEAWETAAGSQQRALMAVARSRTNEPANVARVSVGNAFDDTQAPTLSSGKSARFLELRDGRTFDRKTGKFERD
ncbi:hypothetical protein CTTA_4881 [Comamonas testosteroni]|uniref:Uncharacterized protein n=1 Tax=Comamonas testosteroni TaxID=285 RepID=A0A5A7MJG8_COMTE|nr:hypothetical protein [Comamonas testosteroni]GEQ77876.1 hypothetical protein CTTA_4881 [Comamonas testosteroni]